MKNFQSQKLLGLSLILATVFLSSCSPQVDNISESTSPPVYLPEPASKREIQFSDFTWLVKHGSHLGPGPNYFSDSPEDIWVDQQGKLHMNILQRDEKWYCTEVVAKESLGYGSYVMTLDNRVDTLDENIILGFFTWDTDAPQFNHREIDFEFGRWQDPKNKSSQFVIQPWDTEGNRYRYEIDYTDRAETTTHVMTWKPEGISFVSYYGKYTQNPLPENVIVMWFYDGKDNPPPGGENIRINFWLVWGEAPTDGKDVEMIISDFKFLPVD
ncbi:MAG: hypothetical protein FVQ80_05220 [Planctomycetes bacterium]|nr:hypothetical protein [Planctomycetota bacterium]